MGKQKKKTRGTCAKVNDMKEEETKEHERRSNDGNFMMCSLLRFAFVTFVIIAWIGGEQKYLGKMNADL